MNHPSRDLFGMGWRPEIGVKIGQRIDEYGDIDCLEVIAEEYCERSTHRTEGLVALAKVVPICVHAVSLGMASAQAMDSKRLDAVARLIDTLEPPMWSEHLAFVRHEDVDIGHLAAPPRTDATIEGALRNMAIASQVIGAKPLMENVATLIEPPCSTMAEGAWVSAIIRDAETSMLLDLHNLYANAVNFGVEPIDLLHAMPLDHVRSVHLAGGMLVPSLNGATRLLDDHVHNVPHPVFDLLEELAAHAPHPLWVTIERDGRYPSIDKIAAEILRAREAVARGRSRRLSVPDEQSVEMCS